MTLHSADSQAQDVEAVSRDASRGSWPSMPRQ